MGAGMKRAREEEPVSLALSLTTDSPTTSADSAGSPAATQKKRARRGRVVATSGEGDFVCKTCSRAFTSFQALGGHRTSHLRGRHGLELGVGVAKAIREKKRSEEKDRQKKRARRGRVVATSGEGEFVCKTCSRAFASFQELGGHRTSHLRGRHGLELGVGVAKAIREKKRSEDKQHECHICGLGFEMGQALGGHMRRHREEMALNGGDNQWSIALPDQEGVGHAADRPPVLLELFV